MKLIREISKYDPKEDGKGGHPWFHRGASGVTKPGGHYEKIKKLQRGIKNDIQNYINLCRGGNGGCKIGKSLPVSLDRLVNKHIPLPIIKQSWTMSVPVSDQALQTALHVAWGGIVVSGTYLTAGYLGPTLTTAAGVATGAAIAY